MHGALANAGVSANSGPSELGPTVSRSGAIIEAFKTIFPEHARKTLARLFRLSDGAARKKLTGERELSLNEFVQLLHTPGGFSYLTAVMADSQVQWWRVCAPLMEVAEIQAMQIKARRRLGRAIKGAIDADRQITDAIARADALLVQDEDFHRPHTDAVRAMARVPHRAVAGKIGGRR